MIQAPGEPGGAVAHHRRVVVVAASTQAACLVRAALAAAHAGHLPGRGWGPVGPQRALAAPADPGAGPQQPRLPASRAGALGRFAAPSPVAGGAAAVGLQRPWLCAVPADPYAPAHSGGIERPRLACGVTWRCGCGGMAAGVVSTSSRSLGVHSKAVHNAARVDSFSCAGWRVSSADTLADDSDIPARSASSRRNCAPVHTSRWA